MFFKESIEEFRKSIDLCKKCELWKTRKNIVFGEGSEDAQIMFIGEAPGFNEDIQGRPFVGRAGKILDELLASINLKRKNVYIANILKCRPENNRNPDKKEIEACTEYLNTQIEIISPRILVPLGNFAYQYVFNKYNLPVNKISDVHGEIFKKNTLFGTIYIVPMYHPAIATYNPTKKSILFKDVEILRKLINK